MQRRAQKIRATQVPHTNESDSTDCAIQAHATDKGMLDSDNTAGTCSARINPPLKNLHSHKMKRRSLSEYTIRHPTLQQQHRADALTCSKK